MTNYIKYFNEIGIADVPAVGGKNASLGEMFSKLSGEGILVPDGFATTSTAYWEFIELNGIKDELQHALSELDTSNYSNLQDVGKKCRSIMMQSKLPKNLTEALDTAYNNLNKKYGPEFSLAVRSSATAEDLPGASFAGQQETLLNVHGAENLQKACIRCFASLFTDRAIKYRNDNGFEHMKVALSVGVQLMVRSDQACSGVMFTLDPETGFDKIVMIEGSWGLGENIVQGNVNSDEFTVYKPFIGKVQQPIISRKMGTKLKTMEYKKTDPSEISTPEGMVINVDTPQSKQQQFILKDEEIVQLAEWAVKIENYYKMPMDIEWAKDGINDRLYIVQARPETVHSRKDTGSQFKEFHLREKGNVIVKGMAIGNSIVSGVARYLESPEELHKLREGEILITEKTDPDWDPVLKKASAIITNQGGRTSHAAIVAREVGATAIVGTGDATERIKEGELVTVSTAEGETGYVYEGKANWDEKEIDLTKIKLPETEVMMILGHPDQAFKYAALPNKGVGLMRMEFIINNAIQIHPMALRRYNEISDQEVKQEIEELTHSFPNKEDYFVHKLAEATAVIAAAFYPNNVIVRMSDFKSNEYANLLGGRDFEPHEDNPMIGFRGASRYYHPLYKEAFEMECSAMKLVREKMGFDNIKLMIPFCRTVGEAEKVVGIMKDNGLVRGENGLELYMMVEIPSNAIRAQDFAPYFDGFSIGSNDLTQLVLGIDRDSELLAEIFSPFEPAVMDLIEMSISKAREHGVKIGLCGQAPSDYPEFAKFLVKCGIHSISFNPDALIKGIENITAAEKELLGKMI